MRRFFWLFLIVLAALVAIYVIGSGVIADRSVRLALAHAARQTEAKDGADALNAALRALDSQEQRLQSLAFVFRNANTRNLQQARSDIQYYQQQYQQMSRYSSGDALSSFQQFQSQVDAYEPPSLSVFSDTWKLALQVLMGVFLVLGFGTTAVRVFAGAE